MHACRKLLFAVSAVAGFLIPAASHAQRYNFGITKREVVLQRRLLPDVQLGGISLSVLFDRGGNGLDANVFSSELETLIAQNGSAIRLVTREPQYEIRCYPTEVQRPHIVSKTENKVTTRSAFGHVTMDARLVRAADGSVVLAFTEGATLSASSNANSGAIFGMKLPSFNLPGLHRPQAAAADAPVVATEPLADSETDASLNARLLRSLALHVASHMTPMNEQVTVLLATGGGLDNADKLAQSNRWTEYLEALEAVPPSDTPANEAYRLYDLGVANEALGYAASTPQTALKYLEKASIQYSRAAGDRPDEKYFIPPQKRIETAITRYTAFLDEKNKDGKDKGGNRPAPASAGTAGHFGNADVIKLVQANVPKEVIVSKINSEPDAQFDMSTDGIIALSKANVPADLITQMSRRMNPNQPGPAPASTVRRR